MLPFTNNNNPETMPSTIILFLVGFFSQNIKANIQTRIEKTINDSVSKVPVRKSDNKYFIKKKEDSVPLMTPKYPK